MTLERMNSVENHSQYGCDGEALMNVWVGDSAPSEGGYIYLYEDRDYKFVDDMGRELPHGKFRLVCRKAEPEVKEMTVEQIQERLGHKVKVVEG